MNRSHRQDDDHACIVFEWSVIRCIPMRCMHYFGACRCRYNYSPKRNTARRALRDPTSTARKSHIKTIGICYLSHCHESKSWTSLRETTPVFEVCGMGPQSHYGFQRADFNRLCPQECTKIDCKAASSIHFAVRWLVALILVADSSLAVIVAVWIARSALLNSIMVCPQMGTFNCHDSTAATNPPPFAPRLLS